MQKKGESDHALEILENLEILELLEIPQVKRPLSSRLGSNFDEVDLHTPGQPGAQIEPSIASHMCEVALLRFNLTMVFQPPSQSHDLVAVLAIGLAGILAVVAILFVAEALSAAAAWCMKKHREKEDEASSC